MEYADSKPKNNDNIFVDSVTIKNMTVTYGTKEPWQTYADDISVKLELDIGRDFFPEMYIGGRFKVDDISGEVVGWSSALKVKMLADSLGMPIGLGSGETLTTLRLPADFIDKAKGRKICRLTYLSTKLKKTGGQLWKDWQETRRENIDHAKFKADFMSAVENGYVKDFCRPGQEQTQPPVDNTVGDIPL